MPFCLPPPMVFELGELPPVEAWEGMVHLRNDGEGPLTLRGVEFSCGCVEARLEPRELAPGQLGTLLVTLHPALGQGPFSHTLDVHTSSTTTPIHRFVFQGRVVADITLSTRQIGFLGMVDDQVSSVMIQSQKGVIRSVRAGVTPPWLAVQASAEAQGWRVAFKARMQALPGDAMEGSETVELHLEHPTVSRVRVRVDWQRRWPFVVTPAVVAHPAKGPARVALQVRHHTNEPFTLREATATVQGVRVEGLREVPESGGRAWWVELSLPWPLSAGTLQVTTDREDGPIFTLPIRGSH